uniref:transferrin receptor-like dimerization domain-containing protein n=1 Tax=Isoptericola croceus TaxID=3031406 RepID=UPI0023F8B0C3
APLLNSLEALKESVDGFLSARGTLQGGNSLDESKRGELNRILYRAEQALLHEAGLPRRPWFRHQIYAPGYYTGYGVKTLPGVRESI